jgi:hypothetical protein
MLPTFLGIGAPKSATTWLFRCLQEHPDVFIPGSKQVGYFANDSMPQRRYEQYFDGATEESAVGEITPRYLYSEEVPENTHRTVPDVKLFVSLRNPVDQVYSHFWHLLRQELRNPRPDSFEEALDVYSERLLTPARYHEHLSRWLEYYDQSRLHIILYDDISDCPEETLERLFAFLDVDSSFRPTFLRKKQSRSARTGTSPRGEAWEQVYLKLYDVLRSNVYMSLMDKVGHGAAETIKNTLKVREVMEFLFRSKGYPEMNDETRKELQSYFANDIRNLERLTGRDLSHWH